jgi:CheY-like chemotaxis protein
MSTILLADDSLTIQKVVELTFGETEHEVVAVSEGAELLRRLPELRPDLVICDVIMPGMDGYEVCQQIKSDPATLHIPVVLLTGTFEPFDRDRAIAAGCSEIITKPFEARKLVDTVERLLESDTEAPAPAAADFEPGTVTPPPAIEPEPATAEFGTHLADTGSDEGLEFTSTGFSDMEEAAAATDDWSAEAPDEGLEFEIGDDTANRLSAAEGREPEDEDEPFPEPPALEPDDVEEFTGADTEDAPFADAEPDVGPEEPPAFAPADMSDEPAPEGVAWSPDTDEDVRTDRAEPEGSDEGPFDAMPLEPLDPGSGEFGHDGDSPPDDLAPSELTPPVPEQAETADSWDSDWRTTEAEAVETEHADTTPVAAEPSPSDDTPDADTHDELPASPATEPDIETSEAPASATPFPVDASSGTSGGISDEDVERIARRVAELAAERIEQIAWEVIPDMAEIVIRERVRELEAEIDGATTDHVQ